MSEEKRNLTEEERKELKEKLKKQVDEMSDEELDKVSGGWIKNCELVCNECNKKFNSFNELLEHQKEHARHCDWNKE